MKRQYHFWFLLFFITAASSCQSQESKESASAAKQPAPVYQRLDNEAFKVKLAATPQPQLVDVRTPEEYNAGSIEGAVLINFYEPDFQHQVVQKLDKHRPVFLYCRSGNRSQQAAKILQEAGFREIYELQTGYAGWAK